MLKNKSGSVKPLLEMQQLFGPEARRPWGDTTARHHVKVPGATLWLLAPCGQRVVLQMWPPPLCTCCARGRILPCSSNVTEV